MTDPVIMATLPLKSFILQALFEEAFAGFSVLCRRADDEIDDQLSILLLSIGKSV